MSLSTITVNNKIETSWKSKLERILEFRGILSELTKFRITFFITVTTLVGYILHSGEFNLNLISPIIGVLILASGASALNEYQERNVDSKMKRTSSRPIPSGKLSSNNALVISIILIVFGSGILALQNVLVLVLGLFTLIWYNGIYTPLKQKSAWAIIPGALVGALPPVIGWAASGGGIFDPKIIALASFMFIWQIPHFWLLLLMYDDQYKEAGFPTLSSIFSLNQITKITFLWIAILIASSFVFYFSELSITNISNIVLALTGILTLILSSRVITDQRKEIFGKTFLLINAYVLCVLIIISIENII
jgi:heme o synthase